MSAARDFAARLALVLVVFVGLPWLAGAIGYWLTGVPG